jgi:hypothetical protein
MSDPETYAAEAAVPSTTLYEGEIIGVLHVFAAVPVGAGRPETVRDTTVASLKALGATAITIDGIPLPIGAEQTAGIFDYAIADALTDVGVNLRFKTFIDNKLQWGVLSQFVTCL